MLAVESFDWQRSLREGQACLPHEGCIDPLLSLPVVPSSGVLPGAAFSNRAGNKTAYRTLRQKIEICLVTNGNVPAAGGLFLDFCKLTK